MNFRKSWSLAWMLCWLCLVAASPAQMVGLPSAAEPQEIPAPADGISDRAGFLQRNPALFGRITERFGRLSDQYDFHVYLVIESVLVKDDPHLLATKLRQSWVPDGNGIVLVFEVDSRRLSVGQQLDQTVEADGRILGGIPSFEMNAILMKASQEMKKATNPEEFIETFVRDLTEGLNDYFRRKNNNVPDGRSVRLGMVIVGGASIFALIGLGAAWLLKRSDRGNGKSFYFPAIEATERLGAPYGGGQVSSRRFGTGGSGR